jgi:hypothetical protein
MSSDAICPGKTNGEPCTYAVPPGSIRCPRHDPELAKERGKLGGSANLGKERARRVEQASKLSLNTPAEIRQTLISTMREAFAAGQWDMVLAASRAADNITEPARVAKDSGPDLSRLTELESDRLMDFGDRANELTQAERTEYRRLLDACLPGNTARDALLVLNELTDDAPCVKFIRPDLERGLDTNDIELQRHATYRAQSLLRGPKRIDHPLHRDDWRRVRAQVPTESEHEPERVRVDVSDAMSPRILQLLAKSAGDPDNLTIEECEEVIAASANVKRQGLSQ